MMRIQVHLNKYLKIVLFLYCAKIILHNIHLECFHYIMIWQRTSLYFFGCGCAFLFMASDIGLCRLRCGTSFMHLQPYFVDRIKFYLWRNFSHKMKAHNLYLRVLALQFFYFILFTLELEPTLQFPVVENFILC